MSLAGTNIEQGQKVYYNGKSYTVESTHSNEWITLKDAQGNSFSIRKSQLSSTSLYNCNNYCEDIIKENNKRRERNLALAEKLRTYEATAKDAIKTAQHKMSTILSGANTVIASCLQGEDQQNYNIEKKNFWAATFDKVGYSNRIGTCLLNAADADHDNAMLRASYIPTQLG